MMGRYSTHHIHEDREKVFNLEDTARNAREEEKNEQ